MLIGRVSLEAFVFDWPAHGEVVQHLISISRESERLVGEIVEKAANAGAADAAGFGLQVEHLPDKAGLPIQAAVKPGPRRQRS